MISYAFIFIALLAGQVLSTCSPAGTPKTYSPSSDNTILKNPERGFYKDVESYASKLKPIALSDLQDYWSKDQVSLILINYVLDKFVTSDISSTFLNTITADMKTIRSAGMKAALRFSYTQTEGNKNDAAITQLLKHIAQIKPILQSNSDVVVALQAGFIGTWGEWYYSKNYADGQNKPTAAQQTNRMKIIEALLDALPANRMLQLRYPNLKMQYCKTSLNTEAAQAFKSSIACSRIGIHNDCFMASELDKGTFFPETQEKSLRTWLFNEGQYVMVGGESCEQNANTTCNRAKTQILRQRFTYLNMDYEENVIKSWGESCKKQIANMMGYRFQLMSGTFPAQVTRGTSYCATISLTNTGVTNLMNSRPVQVLLRNKATGALSTAFPVSTDPRAWNPNATITFDLKFTVPKTLSTGLYDVILNLPDAASTLTSPNYRIIFANTGVPEASTRFNILNQVKLA